MSGENPMDEPQPATPRISLAFALAPFSIAIAGPAMNHHAGHFPDHHPSYMVHYEYPVFYGQAGRDDGVKPTPLRPWPTSAWRPHYQRSMGIANPTWEQVQARVMISPNSRSPLPFKTRGQGPRKNHRSKAGDFVRSRLRRMAIPRTRHRWRAETMTCPPSKPEYGKTTGWSQWTQATRLHSGHDDRLQETKDKPVDVTVLRGDQTLELHLPARYTQNRRSETAALSALGFLNRKDTVVTRLPFGQALTALAERKQEILFLLLEPPKVVDRKVSAAAWSPAPLGSPRSRLCGRTKRWNPVLALTSGISLNLGIFNLLPIPILDGGCDLLPPHRELNGHDIALRIKERVYQAALSSCVVRR